MDLTTPSESSASGDDEFESASEDDEYKDKDNDEAGAGWGDSCRHGAADGEELQGQGGDQGGAVGKGKAAGGSGSSRRLHGSSLCFSLGQPLFVVLAVRGAGSCGMSVPKPWLVSEFDLE